jgi:hypothetical protein
LKNGGRNLPVEISSKVGVFVESGGMHAANRTAWNSDHGGRENWEKGRKM